MMESCRAREIKITADVAHNYPCFIVAGECVKDFCVFYCKLV